MKTLYDLQQGESAIIVKVRGRGAFRTRIIEMGFVVGKKVTAINKAPLKDPIEYSIMGYDVSLRRQEAQLIDVIMPNEPGRIKAPDYLGMTEGEGQKKGFIRKDKIINVALVGNPNSGKTSLFNFASNSKERVGNYSGVTVDAKQAHFYQNHFKLNIVALPGT